MVRTYDKNGRQQINKESVRWQTRRRENDWKTKIEMVGRCGERFETVESEGMAKESSG
jgi:hypothetical protein